MEKIRVLLADDHAMFRQAMRFLLEKEDDIEIVGEACSGQEAVELAIGLKPSVIVMDIMMPDLNGVQATSRILEREPESRVIVLSMSGDEEYVNQAISAGAWGYVLKQAPVTELITAIRSVDDGNAYLSPPISKIVLEQMRQRVRDTHELTLREKEILQLIAEGKMNKEISDLLFVSIKTVEKHRQQIMDKLQIHDVAGLTIYAISKGIVKIPPSHPPPPLK